MQRKPKTNDPKEADKVFQLVLEFLKQHPRVEGNIMCAAFMSVVAHNFRESGASYQEYASEMLQMTGFYKKYWDEDED